MDDRAWPDSAMASASCREVRERPGRWVRPDTVQVGPGAKRGGVIFSFIFTVLPFHFCCKILDHQTNFFNIGNLLKQILGIMYYCYKSLEAR